MAIISQKCQYAIRAIIELSKRYGQGPVSVSEMAQTQAIPPRFLELIINQLRKSGVVASKRGARGGYVLLHKPSKITVGDVMKVMNSEFNPVACSACGGDLECEIEGKCGINKFWQKLQKAVNDIYFGTSFEQLAKMQTQAGLK